MLCGHKEFSREVKIADDICNGCAKILKRKMRGFKYAKQK